MTTPVSILKLAKGLANEGVKERGFAPGEFFNGGEFQVRVDEYSKSECMRRGFDPAKESRQLFCQGRFFTDDGREFHFVLNIAGDRWDFKMLDSGMSPFERSAFTFAMPAAEMFFNELGKAITFLLKWHS